MIPPVKDPRVWNSVRWLYVGSGVLFLANISLGITNVFSPDTIARGQILSHFHAGTIGWITLSIIATTLWVFTGQRDVSRGYGTFVAALVGVALVAVAGYIAGFGLFFNGDVGAWILPLFGVPSWLVILSAMILTWTQLKQQPVLTTVHLLLFGSLLVASLGATMGVLRGLQFEMGKYLGPAGADQVGAHAAPMEMYLGLAFAGLVELLVRNNDAARWTKPGLWQTILGVAGGFIGSFSLYVGVPQASGIALLAFLVSFGFYFGRVGWRTFTINPFQAGRAPALFWAGLFYPIYILMFIYLVAVYFIPGRADELPHWLGIIFAHLAFIGAGTNLLLATQSAYGDAGAPPHRWLSAGFWTLNLGMFAFFASEAMADRREGALLMALGVLASLVIVWLRLGSHWTPPKTVAAKPS